MEDSKNKNFIFLFCTVLFLIAIVPQIFQYLFVHPSGKFTIIGLGLAIILIAAILLRWKHTKILFNAVFIIAIAVEIFILSNIWQQYFLPHLLFLIAMIGLTIVFNFSKTIQNWFVVDGVIKLQ